MTAAANCNSAPHSASFFSRLIRGFIQKRRNARAIRSMLEMNDHMLRDIGINRFDIYSALKSRESCGARLTRVVEENRLAQVRNERAATEIRPHSADEQVRMAA